MKKVKQLVWLIPLLALVYIYLSQAAGVLLGSPEHYEILAAMHFSPAVTTALVWLSVVIDALGAAIVVFFPGTYAFLAVGLWTWVPRIITGIYGGAANEFGESFLISVLAILAYLAYQRGYTLKTLFRSSSKN